MKTMNYLQVSRLAKFNKFAKRLQKQIKNGDFYRLSKFKRHKILKKFKRQIKRLSFSLPQGLKHKLAAAGLVLALLGSVDVQGQNNFKIPVEGAFGLSGGMPSLVDIDGDGDYDFFSGHHSGGFFFNRNIGTNTNPNFTARQISPFGLSNSNPAPSFWPRFVDIDADGDFDLFAAHGKLGSVAFYENTGSTTNPQFATAQTNPFGIDSTKLGISYSYSFADIDGDGDLDLFGLGSNLSNLNSIVYLENIGTSTTANFNSSPILNPFGLPNTPRFDNVTFEDLDADGDLDIFLSPFLNYCENTGNDTVPQFGPRQENPFGFVETNYTCYMQTSFADIDADGDLDLFHGTIYNTLVFYENGFFANTQPSFDTTNLVNQTLCLNNPNHIWLSILSASSNDSSQLMSFYAISNNPNLVSDVIVNWPVPLGSGCSGKFIHNMAPPIGFIDLVYKINPNQIGTARITVIADDHALNNNLFTHSFDITVNACGFVNTPPTLNPIGTQLTCYNIATKTIPLTGIGPGGTDPQSVSISAIAADTSVVSNIVINRTGSSTADLVLTHSGISGQSTLLTVTVDDGYNLNNTFSQSFTLNILNCPAPPPIILPNQNQGFIPDNSISGNQQEGLDKNSTTRTLALRQQENFENETKILIQPNPAQDKVSVFIESENILGKFNLEIRNALGQMVHQETINSKQNNFNKNLNLQAFEAGIYFIQIKGIGFEQNEKLIIQK